MRLALSIIVPVFNEEESVNPLYLAVVEAIALLGKSFELVFVDDGSLDRTAEVATQIVQRDPRVRLVQFRRNYGQTSAMAAGIEHARGAILVTMDGDLQNDPADIGRLLEKIAEGYDLVVGIRANRKDKLLTRRIPSQLANGLIGLITGVPISDNGCTLKAYRSDLIKSIPLYAEMHRFIPAMTALAGARITEISVRHHARRFGSSKYGLSRIYKVLLDLVVIKIITAFAARPLLWFGVLAAAPALLGVPMLSYSLWRLGVDGELPLPLAGSGIMLLVSSIILSSAGMLAELLYLLGDTRELDYSRPTHTVWGSATLDASSRPSAHA